jgi:hypothetical protein
MGMNIIQSAFRSTTPAKALSIWLFSSLLLAALLPVSAFSQSAKPVSPDLYMQTQEAGRRSRNAFVLPRGWSNESMGLEPLEFIFDAELDIDEYQRFLRLCYVTNLSGTRAAKSRCVTEIPAKVSIYSGPGKDRVFISIQRPLDQRREVALWVDLINPLSTGNYNVELLVGNDLVKRWTVFIEQPRYDSPGSGD